MKCFFQVLGFFLNGETDIVKEIDGVLFAFTLILVLLTIVIAIVTDAWTSVETRATEMYWQNRISYLVDMHDTLSSKLMLKLGQLLSKKIGIGEKIDKFFYDGLFNDNMPMRIQLRDEIFYWNRS